MGDLVVRLATASTAVLATLVSVIMKCRAGTTSQQQQSAISVLRSRPSVNDLEWIGDDLAVLRDSIDADASHLASLLGRQRPATVLLPRFDRYAEVGYVGTSMAAPHVSGLAALLISQGITNPAAVEAMIKATARDLGTPGRDDETGSGLIQARTALRGLGVK